MKKQNPNQNNPVVIGALLVVLLGAVVVIFRSFVPQNELAFTPAPKPAAPPSSGAASSDAAALTPVARDPFFHSDIQRIAASGEKLIAPISAAPSEGGAFASGSPFESPLASGESLTTNPTAKDKIKPVAKNAAPAPPKRPVPPDPTLAENALTQTLRLTAVLGGGRPRAIVEGFGSQPVVVSAGDTLGILRVVAVRAQEIVLSGKSGLWTIPLQSAAPAEAALPPAPIEPAADSARPATPVASGSKERNDEAGK